MKKETIELKQGLTDVEMVGFIQELADAYFTEHEDGTLAYTPYLARIQFRTLFYLYCVEGLTFDVTTTESGEKVLENILEAADRDEELTALYTDYNDGKYNDLPIATQLAEISSDAYDMAEFRKQQILHFRKDSLANLIDTLAAKAAELDLSKFDVQTISEAIVNSYLSNGAYTEKADAGNIPDHEEQHYEN